MHNKLAIIILIIFLAVFGIFVLSDSKFNYFLRSSSEDLTLDSLLVTKEMNGRIVSVNGDVITVIGKVGDQTKTIDFQVTKSTVFKKTTLTITLEQMQSGKEFKPDTKIENGRLSDMASGVSISKIVSSKNLENIASASALEINYLIYNVPNAPKS